MDTVKNGEYTKRQISSLKGSTARQTADNVATLIKSHEQHQTANNAYNTNDKSATTKQTMAPHTTKKQYHQKYTDGGSETQHNLENKQEHNS
jgi:hypothetical protein